MSWVAFDDAVLGSRVLELSGNTVEVFSWRTTEAQRMHVGLLHVSVEGPNRRGLIEVAFRARPGRLGGGGFTLNVDAANWEVVRPLVETVQARLDELGAS